MNYPRQYYFKTCPRCKIEKLKEDFGPQKFTLDGLAVICGPCQPLWAAEVSKQVQKYIKSRQDAIIRATPKWLTEEHKQQILDFYRDREALNSMSDILFHVDHIVPLRGKNVSGLNVPWNLRIVSAAVNIKKGNRL